jgi:PAS domain S-box-containing protein
MTAAQPRWRLAAGALLTLAYVVSGKLGLMLAFLHASATAVWPPAGLALAGFLLLGPRLWPFVLAGAFLVNQTTAGSTATSLAIASGNTLAGLWGASLVERFARGDRAFEQPKSLFRYVAFALLSTALSASVGVASLALGGFLDLSQWGSIWLTWWIGDTGGTLIVAPLVLLWIGDARLRWTRAQLGELALLLSALVLLAQLLFGRGSPLAESHHPLAFLVAPILVWAAFRFGPRETVSANFLFAGAAVVGTLRGLGPFAQRGPNVSLLLLQAFLCVTAVLGLALAAAVLEQKRQQEAVRLAEEQLRLLERQRSGEALRNGEAQLAEAQAIAHIGSWSWERATDRISWSAELYRIFGLSPSETPLNSSAYLSVVHPDDRELVRASGARSLQSGEPFAVEHRIVRPDGTIRWVHGRGRRLLGDHEPTGMLGTAQDITDRKRAELVMSEFIANAAHELRTPLTTMAGIAELLATFRRQLDETQIEEHCEMLRRQGERARYLITGLLNLSRVEQGLMGVEMQPVRLRHVAQSALDAVPAPSQKQVQLAVPGELEASADPMRLEEILVNLLTNAYRYGGRQVVLEAAGAEDVLLAVCDDGDGVPEALLPTLFEPFTRGLGHQKIEGSGLGLTIARRLAVAMGGGLSYEPGRPRGARFVVRLQRAG